MPPKRNIVKSGNAGTSSKAPKQPSETSATKGDIPPPLFPPGSKTPLALLYERCQKNGWEKPEIETYRRGPKYTATVIVQRKNIKTGNKDAIRFEPHPPLDKATIPEAKHWAATYALYRFCNNIQLNRVLPTGPREYWQILAEEHRTIPEHKKWQYDPDPFAAKAAVEERQRRAAAKRDKPETEEESDLRIFDGNSDVRMATTLRDQVESAIKKVIADYPETNAGDTAPSFVEDERLITTLSSLGFKSAHIRTALESLSIPSPLTTSLLGSLPPLEATIEYLLLHIPESDLPARFLPENNSSKAFISSAHAGAEDILQRWAEERATREAGYPRLPVKAASEQVDGSWDLILEVLASQLTGFDPPNLSMDVDIETRDMSRQEELEAVQAVYPDATFNDKTGVLSIPLPTVPAFLNVIYSPDHPYPEGARVPPLYVTSSTMAPYVRLYLISELVKQIAPEGTREAGDSICFTTVDLLDQIWQQIEESGPPDMAEVIKNLMPPPKASAVPAEGPLVSEKGPPKPKRFRVMDTRSDEQILKEFNAVKEGPKYKSMLAQRQKLPAWASQEEIVKVIGRSRVVVIVGETGCGKTTQLPQFILDEEIRAKRGSQTSIIITQPRRVSAIGVASRVSAERAEDGSVGYAIRGESKTSPKTKLLFCTTGVVLRRLGGGDKLENVSHIIVDEVHERSVDGDFLLLELKELLQTNSTIKVVIMSATINQKTFVEYFGGAPVIEIPGFTHPVKDYYLEDILPVIKYKPTGLRFSGKKNDDQIAALRTYLEGLGLDSESVKALEILKKGDRIDYNLVAAIASYITQNQGPGAILIFMPGVPEIRQCIDALKTASIGPSVILPLHANLSSNKQRRVFQPTDKRKIVVATNVAETSITIDDVVFVIDGGKVKETGYDPETGLSRLEEVGVTRASARQRRGRAGRTKPGECYKLFTRGDEENMRKFPVPEILRVPLESLSLQIKVMREEEDVKLFLGRTIDPPKVAAMEKAWSVLEELGAVNSDGDLTALGRHMATLPVDLRLGKMLILGAIFRCLDPILTIAAGLSSKPLFVSPMDKREEATKARLRFAVENSDLLTDERAFRECRSVLETNRHSSLQAFCEDNFISYQAFRDISSLRTEFESSLDSLSFIPRSTKEFNIHSDSPNLLKSIILAGLWPRVAKVALPKAMFNKIASGTIQREHEAREVKYYTQEGESGGRGERVFLHPGSVLFGNSTYKSRFLVYFAKSKTTKIFLRDATEVPLYAILLFGGQVQVNHLVGGLSIGNGWVKLKAWPRIGVLVNQLRRLLDAQLRSAIEDPSLGIFSKDNPIVDAMLALLTRDGMGLDQL